MYRELYIYIRSEVYSIYSELYKVAIILCSKVYSGTYMVSPVGGCVSETSWIWHWMAASSHSRSGGQQFVSGRTTPGWGAIDWPRGLTILTQITAIPMCVHVCMCACVRNGRGG